MRAPIRIATESGPIASSSCLRRAANIAPILAWGRSAHDGEAAAEGRADVVARENSAVVEALGVDPREPERRQRVGRLEDVHDAAPARDHRAAVRLEVDVLHEVEPRGEGVVREEQAVRTLPRTDAELEARAVDLGDETRPVRSEGDEVDLGPLDPL